VLEQIDEHILQVATNHLAAAEHAKQLLEKAEDRLISGSPGTISLKRYGHRPLSQNDVDSIINALGSDVDKQAIANLGNAQRALSERLKGTAHVGLVIEQAHIPYAQYYQRSLKPELWKPEQMVAVVEVLKRLRV
jgi:uncharacterized protein YqeY